MSRADGMTCVKIQLPLSSTADSTTPQSQDIHLKRGISMRSALIALTLVLAATFTAHAGELDNEAAVTNQQAELAADLPATLVVRVNANSNEVEVLHSKDKIAGDETSKATVLARENEFVKMDVKGQMTGELDRDSSRSSWYFCFPTYNWFYPTYFYYNYTYAYTPYYYYSIGAYSYYYYTWNRW